MQHGANVIRCCVPKDCTMQLVLLTLSIIVECQMEKKNIYLSVCDQNTSDIQFSLFFQASGNIYSVYTIFWYRLGVAHMCDNPCDVHL